MMTRTFLLRVVHLPRMKLTRNAVLNMWSTDCEVVDVCAPTPSPSMGNPTTGGDETPSFTPEPTPVSGPSTPEPTPDRVVEPPTDKPVFIWEGTPSPTLTKVPPTERTAEPTAREVPPEVGETPVPSPPPTLFGNESTVRFFLFSIYSSIIVCQVNETCV